MEKIGKQSVRKKLFRYIRKFIVSVFVMRVALATVLIKKTVIVYLTGLNY